MKITKTADPARTERTQPNAGGAARTSGAAAQPAASSSGDSGRVQLSALSNRLSQLEAQFPQSSFDAAKVSEVRAAIAEGRYQINTGVIADKLIASASQLAGRKV
ncbi:MAG TPA: flagellar biosynthesis anti-sigma factor FlgM [Burkholderiaceae bacterium]|nr:flagellar biosynthesis anti-sigma factor FlgM [Burkholderiaceae bacterium]